MVRVVAHLRRQIEGDAQAADALREQIAIARVRLRGRSEAGVLPHRPQPAAVHRRLDAAREREFAGEAEFRRRVPAGEIVRRAYRGGRTDAAHAAIVTRLGTDSVAVSA